MDTLSFDFPCSATFRHFDTEEHYGLPRIDYEPRADKEVPDESDYQFKARLDVQEKSINHLYALMAMRQVEVTGSQYRRHKPRY